MIKPIYKGETAIICATGPSITSDVIQLCNKAKQDGKLRLFGMNLAYTVFDLDVFHACNYQFYDYYYPNDYRFRIGSYKKWTTRPELQGKYNGVEYIKEIWEPGFSTNPDVVHAHHGSSLQLMNLALHYGIKRMGLVGFDMRYSGKISNKEYSNKRHFFGEYPKVMQHWPKTDSNGDLGGLIKEFETVTPSDYDIEIINLTEDSALKCFTYQSLSEFLKNLK